MKREFKNHDTTAVCPGTQPLQQPDKMDLNNLVKALASAQQQNYLRACHSNRKTSAWRAAPLQVSGDRNLMPVRGAAASKHTHKHSPPGVCCAADCLEAWTASHSSPTRWCPGHTPEEPYTPASTRLLPSHCSMLVCYTSSHTAAALSACLQVQHNAAILTRRHRLDVLAFVVTHV
jgi:hypothetical protein